MRFPDSPPTSKWTELERMVLVMQSSHDGLFELPVATHCSWSYLGCHPVVFHHSTSCIVQIRLVPALARCRSTLTCISDLYYAVAVRRPSVPSETAAVCTSVPWFIRGACIGTRTVAAWLPAHTAIRDCTSCYYQMGQCNIRSSKSYHREIIRAIPPPLRGISSAR